MARTINIPSATYQPGVITQEIGQFGNVDQLRLTFTVATPWPGTPDQDAVILKLEWDAGGGVGFKVPAGQWTDKQGNPTLSWFAAVSVPKVAGPNGQPAKRSVTKGTVTAEFLMEVTTAITIEAL